jgi:hypothetical protein
MLPLGTYCDSGNAFALLLWSNIDPSPRCLAMIRFPLRETL